MAASATTDELTALLDVAEAALLLLTPSGQIVFANRAALAFLSHDKIMKVDDGLLSLRRAEDDAALRDAMAQLTAAKKFCTVCLRSREALAVVLLDLHLAPGGGLLTLRIIDLRSVVSMSITRLASIFGLTPAESRVANGLFEGLSITSIAVREGNAVETIRGHVKRAMAKLSVRSQAQFVSILVRARAALIDPDAGSLPRR